MEVGHSAMTKRKGQWSTKHYTKKLKTWNPQQSRVWTQLVRRVNCFLTISMNRTSSCRSQWDEVRLFDKTISNRPISWLREIQGTGFASTFTGNRLRQYIYKEQASTVYLQGTGFDSIFTGNRLRQYIYREQALTVYLLPFLFSLFIVSQPYFDSLFILLCVSLTGKTMSINHFTGTPFFRETTMERPRLHKMKRNLSLIGNT
jgi:hypothetical protein